MHFASDFGQNEALLMIFVFLGGRLLVYPNGPVSAF